MYGFTANDINGPYYRKFYRPSRAERRAERRQRSASLRLVQRFRSLRDLFYPEYGSYLYELDYNYFENEGAWNFFTSGLEELARISTEQQVCGHVLLHTWIKDLHALHPFQHFYDAVEKAARERGLGATPTLDRYLWNSAAGLHVAPDEKHPNADGHAILASALEDGLRSLPDRCWSLNANTVSRPH